MPDRTFVTASLTDVGSRPPAFTVAAGAAAPARDAIQTGLGTRPPVDPADCVYFACDLVHEGRNGNGDIFTRAEMERAWRTLIGKPVDKDHILGVDGAVGKIYDAKFDLDASGRAVIRVAGYVHARLYPDVAWKLLDGIVTGVSMECLFDMGEHTGGGRVLHGVHFVGLGLTRMPADDESHIDHLRESEVTASRDRRDLLLLAAAAVALQEACALQEAA